MPRFSPTRTPRPCPLGTLAARVLSAQSIRATRTLPGAAKCHNPERIHDLRVAIRRSRVALKLFHSCIPDDAWRPVRKELSWLSGYLGAVRDYDVGLALFDQLCSGCHVPADALLSLRASLLDERARHVAALRKALQRPRAVAALAALSRAARSARACATPLSHASARDFLTAAILSTLKDILAAVDDDVARLCSTHLHQLRIACKRLRYLCEFARTFFRHALAQPIASLVTIQDCLGRHQDLATFCTHLEQRVRRYAHRGSSASVLLLACGAVLERAHAAMQRERAAFAELWRSFPAIAAQLRSLL